MRLPAIIILLCLGLASSAQWRWLHPFPQGEDIVAIEFFSPDTGYALAKYGPFMKTMDGGQTWEIACYEDQSPFMWDVWDMDFANPLVGYVCGQGHLYKSIDGGNTWTVSNALIGHLLYEIQFFDEMTGYASGYTAGSGSGKLFGTTDGGSTWAEYFGPGSYNAIRGMYFLTPSTGWIATYYGLFKTTDSCRTWQQLSTASIHEVFFLDEDFGWIISGGKTIFRTTDGGLNWDITYMSGSANYDDIWFINQNTGWIVGREPGNICARKTTDGGVTWEPWFSDPATTLTDLWVIDEQNIWTAGGSGALFSTHDAGITWNTIRRGPIQTVSVIWPVQADPESPLDTIWAAGTAGLLMRTYTGGLDWEIISTGFTNDITDMCFPSATTGYLAGKEGALYKSADGGDTWEWIPAGDSLDYTSVFFLDEVNGWATTTGGQILKTTDGGQTWLGLSTGIDCRMNDVWFIDESKGFAVGHTGMIGYLFTTDDGGSSWTYTERWGAYYKVKFTDALTGWVLGIRHSGSGEDYGILMGTSDGGSNWTQLSSFGHIPVDFAFADEDNGWFIGDPGYVLYTWNGGISWTMLHMFTNNDLLSCFATNSGNLTVAGQGGVIATMCADTGTTSLVAPRDHSGETISIYPNPAREYAMVDYYLEKRTLVMISVFDLYGHLLEHKSMLSQPGNHQFTIHRQGKPAGIYLVKIQSGARADCTRLIFL